ncbi:MAG: SLC13 family permease [Caldilineaceae bacterium]|nr:SLC13 family permease [Caldilineaceae bacterium]
MEHFVILGLIGVAMLLFAFEVVRPDIVALGVTLILLLGGFVSIEEGFSGFSNPAVITVIAMFILSAGLVRTGVADYLAQIVIKIGGASPIRLTIAVMLCVGIMSAFMNNIGAVAVLLPTIFVIARKSEYPAEKLLIPLSFGSLLGGLVTLIGTPPNLLVSIALEEHGFEGFKLFDFAPTGLAVMITGILYLAFVGRHLIPQRGVAGDLMQQYQLADYVTELVIPAESPLIGQSIEASPIQRKLGLTILRMMRSGQNGPFAFVPVPQTVLEAEDRLIVEGDLTELLSQRQGTLLNLYAERKFTQTDLTGDGVELAEIVIAPNSQLRGRAIREIDFRRRYAVLVLALKRRGRIFRADTTSEPLESGDLMLVQGSQAAIKKLATDADFLVVNRLEHEPRQLNKAPIALAIMLLAIGTAATGVLHISVAAMLGVLLMALTGCVKIQTMYTAVEWRVIFLIALMMPLGLAMDSEHTGTAAWLADHILSLTGGYGPLLVMASLFIFTTLITEIMSNAAAAVLLAPIAIAISVGMGLQPYPFLMSMAIAASTTFLTPIGHQANVLVYGVGGYRFTDFPRTGGLLNILIFIVAMIAVPLVWPFTPL